MTLFSCMEIERDLRSERITSSSVKTKMAFSEKILESSVLNALS